MIVKQTLIICNYFLRYKQQQQQQKKTIYILKQEFPVHIRKKRLSIRKKKIIIHA